MRILPLVLNEPDSEQGIRQLIICLLFIVLLISSCRKNSVCITYLFLMKKHLLVLKQRSYGNSCWTLVLMAVYSLL